MDMELATKLADGIVDPQAPAEPRTLTVAAPNPAAIAAPVSFDVLNVEQTDIDSEFLALDVTASLGRISAAVDRLEAARKAAGEPLRETIAWVNEQYAPYTDRLDVAVNTGKTKLLQWQAKVREQQLAAARAAEEKRRQEAADAAAKAAALEAEARAEAERAAQLRAQGDEAGAQVAEAAASEAADAATAVESVLHRGPTVVAPSSARVKGSRTTWKGEVTNKALLILEIAERIRKDDRSLLDLVDVVPKELDALARSQKQHLRIPGLRAYDVSSVSIRKAA